MQRISKSVTKTVGLADQLLEDIKRRDLKPGASYLTTQAARRFLGVGGTAANRALQLLEKRGIIERTQGKGAVILRPPSKEEAGISRVHILIPEIYFRTEGFGCDGILFGLQSEFPTAYVSHFLLLQDGDTQRIEKLIHDTIASGGTDAFVLASVPFEIQRAIARAGFPAVVYGTAYRGIGDIPQLERDIRSGVVMMVDHLRSRGTQNIAVLLRQYLMPGDQLFFDAVMETLGGSTSIRFLAADKEHMEAEIIDILRRDRFVNAFLCQTTIQAEAVRSALKKEGLNRDDIRIGVLLSYAKRNEQPKFTHIQLVPSPEEIGRKIARILQMQHIGQTPKNQTIPVELVAVST